MLNQLQLNTDQYDSLAKDFLRNVVNTDNTHAKWLNLLSYLEFIGSRKIFKTQQPGVINESVLKHASDEARHAFFLKQLITQISDLREFENYDFKTMLAPYSGFRYIQSLDAMVKRRLNEPGTRKNSQSYICYVYMSFIIEIRANWLYDLYDQILKESGSKVNISMIISDEIRHLAEMKAEISKFDKNSEENILYFLKKENSYFNRLINSLNREVSK